MSDRIRFIDSTLRDGSHAIKHQLTTQNIIDYCDSMDSAGLDAILVGHGNGLGASSLEVGLSKLSDHEMLSTAKAHLHKTKLGAFMIPGFGTIKDNLIPAINDGVSFFEIACNCTEADTTQEHIRFLRSQGKEVIGVLMMYHTAPTAKIVEESLKMQSYGAQGLLLMDSAGASLPELVKKTIDSLKEVLSIPIGFHAHNNLGLSVGNTYLAIKEGASFVDCTLSGFGAGAGNCPMEALTALLRKENIQTSLNLTKLFDTADDVLPSISGKKAYLDSTSIASGMAGVFSGFKLHVIRVAKEYNLNPRLIFQELGEENVIGGQEDSIYEIAAKLCEEKNK